MPSHPVELKFITLFLPFEHFIALLVVRMVLRLVLAVRSLPCLLSFSCLDNLMLLFSVHRLGRVTACFPVFSPFLPNHSRKVFSRKDSALSGRQVSAPCRVIIILFFCLGLDNLFSLCFLSMMLFMGTLVLRPSLGHS